MFFFWDALYVNVNPTKTFSINEEKCLVLQLKIFFDGETARKNSYLFLRYGRTCKEVRRKVLGSGKQKDEEAIVHRFNAWMITTSSKRIWKQSENCPMYVPRFS